VFAYIIPVFLTIAVYYYAQHSLHIYNNPTGKYIMSILPFLPLIAMSVFRENIGVDYSGYELLYNNIKAGIKTNAEIGFEFLAKLIIWGFDDVKILFAIFSVFTLINFIIAIRMLSTDLTFSVSLFILLGYYNLTYNAVRYYYALSVVLLAYAFFLNKEYKNFLIAVIFAACFHKTSLIVLPVCYIFRNRSQSQKHYVYLILMAVAAVILKHPIRYVAFKIYPSYLYSVYDGGSASITNVFKCLFLLMLGICFYGIVRRNDTLIFCHKLNIVALILYVCCSWLPELSRIGYYFNVLSVIFIPDLVKEMKSEMNRRVVSVVTVLGACLYYVFFLERTYAQEIHLLPYRTWLFHLNQ
jgi:hypothetical protein